MKVAGFLDKWHETRTGFIVMGLFELGFAYIFASWSLDTGSWFDYMFMAIFLFGGLYNFANLTRKLLGKTGTVGKMTNGKRKPAKA
jgi:hypothetical protein